MFVAFDRAVRVNLAVITLGAPDRLRRCLDALRQHGSRHDFSVSVVVNGDAVDLADGVVTVEDGMAVDRVPYNAGWSGGLHRARALTDAELLVWVQDDMVPEPGWLDALVAAAEEHPRAGGFGSVRVDAEGRAALPNAGTAEPPGAVERWNDTDTTTAWSGVTTHDWVASTGFLTRAAAWDELGGTDPRFWPVTHGDKDYCTHLRCHGWDVVLVADARVRHAGSQSAPSSLRAFIATWREPWFNRRWSGPVRQLAGRSSAVVEHPCGEWHAARADALRATVGDEASRLLVPLARGLAEEASHFERAWSASHVHAEELTAALAAAQARLESVERTLTEVTAERDRARRRARRLRRRLDQPTEKPRRWRRLLRRLG